MVSSNNGINYVSKYRILKQCLLGGIEPKQGTRDGFLDSRISTD